MASVSIEIITQTATRTIDVQTINAIATGSASLSVTSVPLLIAPPDNVLPPQPENSTLVQVGFFCPLNYAFVAYNSTAIA